MTEPSLLQLTERAASAFAVAVGTGRGASTSIALVAPGGLSQRLLAADFTDSLVYLGKDDFEGSTTARRARGESHTVGLGSMERFRLEGESRFAQAEARVRAFFKSHYSVPEAHGDVRFYGGGSFSINRPVDQHCWDNFGDATFLLPRVTYVDQAGTAKWICSAKDDAVDVEKTLALLRELVSYLERTDSREQRSLRIVSRRETPEPDAWRRLVDEAVTGIRAGNLSKVVATRRVTLELDHTPSLAEMISRMGHDAPACTRFAVRMGDRTFTGATPERLLAKHGSTLETEALAGTINSQVPNATAQLLASEKDLSEHQFVVEAIKSSLASRCERLDVPAQPGLRTLRRLHHLHTPIRGELPEDTHALSLLDTLHPTPAVGGTPRAAALSFIREHESADRGWFAAPFGWVDENGDGDFVVALRSALFHRNKVHLYAGAGLVEASDAEAELNETELKLDSMLSAIGVSATGTR